MSRYVSAINQTTAIVHEDDFSSILSDIKERASSDKYISYGWRNELLETNHLIDAMKVFGIKLVHVGLFSSGFCCPIINDVYVSVFFKDMIQAFAPYAMGGIVVADSYGDCTTIDFKHGEVKTDSFNWND